MASTLYHISNKKPGDYIREDTLVKSLLTRKLKWMLFIISEKENEIYFEIVGFLKEFAKDNVFEFHEIFDQSQSRYINRYALGYRGWDVHSLSYLFFWDMGVLLGLFYALAGFVLGVIASHGAYYLKLIYKTIF